MLGCVEVFRGVLVLGGIAASHMPAGQAQPQMHPRVAHLDALLATSLIRVLELYLIQMFADFGHV
jgi:hypothetical protein